MRKLLLRYLFVWTALIGFGLAVAACSPTEPGETGAEPEAAAPAEEPMAAVTETDAAADTEASVETEAAPAGEGSAAAPPEGSEPKGAVEGDEATALAGLVEEAGSAISGRVTYEGEQPKRRPLDTEADPACAAMHSDEPLRSDATVVSEDGGVLWAFAYIQNPPKKDYEIPSEPAKLDQVGCRYTPHVQGMRAGQELEIHNSDDTTHNVRTFPTRGFDGKYINKTINFGQPGPGTRTQVFENPEKAIKVKCDIHPWMQAYIFAMDHPYFDTTDENGNYAIPTADLPPGDYEVVVWHEEWDEQTQTVTVGEDGTATVDFTYSDSE